MSKCDRPFNVLFDADDVAMLAALAAKLKSSKAHVIRDAIRYRFNMILNGTPTCASGAPCLVPALHAQGSAPPVPNATPALTDTAPPIP